MATLEKIKARLPRFYKCWDNESLISILLQSISSEMELANSEITELIKSHWVDTARGDQLDCLCSLVGSKRYPNETDEHLRAYLKKAVDEIKGGGTVSVILESLRSLIKNEENFRLIENPPIETVSEVAVKANDTWQLGSNSIENEQATISVTVEEDGEVINPQLSNQDTNESLIFNGTLKKGDELILKQNSALLNSKDVTENMSPSIVPVLRRKRSTWKYSEALQEKIGVFNKGRFDEHTFAIGVPTVKLRFEWIRRQPATFMVQVKSEALKINGLSEDNLQKAMDSLKGVGVNAIVKITEELEK